MLFRSFENISDTGTEGTKVASGTTAQRGSTTGQWRYNTTTGFFEGRNTSGSFSTLEPSPTVTSVDDTEVDSAGGGNQTIVITGTNFTSGSVASFVGSSASFNASTTTVDNVSQITAVAPKASFLNAQEPYKVKVTSGSGLAGTSATGLINVDNAPAWSTSSGSLGSLSIGATGTHATVSATDAEGETVVYTVQSGSLPTGLSLNSSTGVISGTIGGSASTFSFTLRATANTKTSDRAFTITTNAPVYVQLSGSGTWAVPSGVTSAEILVVGGGASGGRSPNVAGGGGGGGGILHASSYTFTSTDISSGIAYSIGAGGSGVGMNNITDDEHGGTEGIGQYGHDTTFAISGGTLTAKGGGYGGGYDGSAYRPARQGGSGGGGAWDNLTGASSNQASFSGWTKYGNSGGTFNTAGSGGNNGAGGGGAGASGGNANRGGNPAGGVGGAGQLFSSFTAYGENGYFGGGGAGGDDDNSSSVSGGIGGGGNGGHTGHSSGYNGTDTVGGGGGGASSDGYNNHTYRSGYGGSGTILIKY